VKVVVLVGHVGSLQGTPFGYFWQPPAWHMPFVPHEPGPMSWQMPAGSGAPVATFVHTPSVPDMPHDWHEPVHALSQQTPCAQNVERHSALPEHDAPLFLRPHELPLQTLGGRQFAVAVHAWKHVVPLHVYGLQGSWSGAAHWPVELHVEGGVYTLAVQLSGAQIVPILYFWQPPAPSHLPFVEHDAAVMSWQTPRGSALPAGIDVHLPGDDASEQLRHAPVQTVSQQTPSTQWVERHSVPAEQAPPLGFGPHRPLTHAWVESQSLSERQTLLHAPSAQLNGLQFWTPCGRHVPRPSQVPGVLRRVPVHDGAMHWVSAGYF
jgi:hypothetical protein